jgi:hypothetical protein
MDGWKKERAGDGRYHVRGADGYRMIGIIIGGNGRWFVEVGGHQWARPFRTAKAAAAALADYHAAPGPVVETATGRLYPGCRLEN